MIPVAVATSQTGVERPVLDPDTGQCPLKMTRSVMVSITMQMGGLTKQAVSDDDQACYFSGPPETRGLDCTDGVLTCDSQNELITGCAGSIGPDSEVRCLDQTAMVIDESCCDTDPSCEGVSESFRVGKR